MDETGPDAGPPIDQLLAELDFSRSMSASAEARRRELAGLLSGVVELVDALEALDVRTQGAEINAPVGIALRQALRLISTAGVSPVESLDKPLDLNLCEVVEVQHVEGAPADTVVTVLQRGYLWRGRLLRRAKVIVAGGEARAHGGEA